MKPGLPQLLIISRKPLQAAQSGPHSEAVFACLAKLSRKGCHLLLTAPEPDQWLPTRGNVDHALAQQGALQSAIHAAGGNLDGLYYVPRSLFTQNHNREGALRDILARYALEPGQVLLMSGSAPFLKAAARLGMPTQPIPAGEAGPESLEAVLSALLKA